MHLNDAIFLHTPTGIALVAAAGAISFTGLSLGSRGMQAEETTRAGMVTAFVFVASLMHVPIPPTSIHLGLYGLAGILLGRRIWLVGPIAFGLQAILFGHGGICSIGLNALNMSLGALVGRAWFLWRSSATPDRGATVAAFGAGFLAIVVMVGLIVVELLIVGTPVALLAAAPLWIGTATVEGIVTAIAIGTLHRAFPELLPHRRQGAAASGDSRLLRSSASEAPA